MRSRPMLKCSSERWVCAPQSLSEGTSTTPRLSVSFLMSVIGLLLWSGFQIPKDRIDRSAGFACASGLEQEPGAPLSLIDPVLEQACGRHVAVFLAQVVRLAHICRQLFVVLPECGQHIQRRDITRVVIKNPLRARFGLLSRRRSLFIPFVSIRLLSSCPEWL